MILQNINKAIDTEYEEKKRAAEHLAATRKEEIYHKFPEICQIDRVINTLGILIGYAAMRRVPPASLTENLPDDRKQAYLSMNSASLNQEIDRLRDAKQKRLRAYGCPPDYMEAVYTCNACQDTGFVKEKDSTEKSCACRQQLLAAKLKEAAGIPPEDTFTRFDICCYAELPDQKKYGISVAPRVQMDAVYKRCVRFAERFEDPAIHNMAFVGNAGLGKTFLGNCIMNQLTDRGISCLYMPATALFKPFAPGYYTQEKAAEIADFILTCELLLIDDLGSEKQTDARYSELLEILNARAQRARTLPCKTIITTNLTPANLFSYYGERVASRVLGSFDILRFAGEDIRLKQKYNGM